MKVPCPAVATAATATPSTLQVPSQLPAAAAATSLASLTKQTDVETEAVIDNEPTGQTNNNDHTQDMGQVANLSSGNIDSDSNLSSPINFYEDADDIPGDEAEKLENDHTQEVGKEGSVEQIQICQIKKCEDQLCRLIGFAQIRYQTSGAVNI